nr:gamma-glutamylcyclotransferase family protein [uncultured Desulfobacter sp.]
MESERMVTYKKDLPENESIFLFNSLPEELYYFAYGPNMNASRINERSATAKMVTIARLADYRIAFFGHSRIWDGAQANAIREPGHEVWGVVYEFSGTDLERLDAWQDVRMDGTGTFFHYPVRVIGKDGLIYTALMYEKDTLGKPEQPSTPYLDFIIQGAKENHLPAEYIRELKGIKSRQPAFPVPKSRMFNPESLLTWDCSSCSD